MTERTSNPPAVRRALLAGAFAVALSAPLAGCAASVHEIPMPPAHAVPDYQLGGAYAPQDDVTLVVRDRTAKPDPHRYSVCYINGFQTQPGELDEWPAGTVLTREGEPVMDPDWPDEALLDTSTAENRDRIADRVGGWIDGCAAAGFDAVEFDNLDTFTRSDGALTLDDNLALATNLVTRTHAAGLAAGQKNSPEQSRELRDTAGFDFAVSEECAVFDECGSYTKVYGDRVFDIEYTDELPRPFTDLCEAEGAPRAMILRDRDLTTPGDPEYTFEVCER